MSARPERVSGWTPSPRRFRYTFITRFLREGGSLNAAAEAADHTDTRTVLTYTNKRGDLVARLDEAVALEMAPRAMAFLGMVVRSEAEAVRGEAGAASRIYHHARDRGAIEPVGTCGSFAFCGLTAPDGLLRMRPVPALARRPMTRSCGPTSAAGRT